MLSSKPYPKRLIEVDLPIKEISAHARREKSIRHGHISTLHIWWARRPLAACRAVLCAALWPDPVDDKCPQAFRDAASRALCDFAEKVRSDAKLADLCAAHWTRWNRTNAHSMKGKDPACWPDMRYALLDFIADFANWDASTVPAFLETARALTQAAHEALGGLPGTRPLVVDPFAGGGAIPLEALRIGADAFASDLNPVAVLLNKVVLEYIPRYGQRLADEVRKWGQWIKEQTEQELAEFYPKDEDGATPIAYLWARTIRCEGPGCGAEVPLIRSPWLAKRRSNSVALRLVLLTSPAGRCEERGGGGEVRAETREAISLLAGRYRNIPDLLLQRARELRQRQTPAEELLWECLRNRQLLGAKFRRQHNIGPYIADFYCHEARLIVELDGPIHDRQRGQDRFRDEWATGLGLTVLRFKNEQVLGDTEEVLATIAGTLTPTPQPPPPLPEGEGEGAGGGSEGKNTGRGQGEEVRVEIFSPTRPADVGEGTVRRGSATCPVCGYTTPVVSVRRQLKGRRGGAADARLLAVVATRPGQPGRFYRLPNERDLEAARRAAEELERRQAAHEGPLSLVPDEEISLNEIRRISVPIYGMTTWGDLFTPRQALALATLVHFTQLAGQQLASTLGKDLAVAVQTCLALAVDRQADATSSLCRWHLTREIITGTFGRQAIPMVWDFSEVPVLSKSTGGFSGAIEWVSKVCATNAGTSTVSGQAEGASATVHPLPDDSANAVITDPPYYDAVPYAYLSDFFYVWLRRALGQKFSLLLVADAVPKDAEIVVDRPHALSASTKDIGFYERELTRAFAEGRRLLRPDGIGTIVFASKTTASWEAILQAIVDAGWRITGSWPIDTEMEARVAAQGQARLASSVHVVCRPRETAAGEVDQAAVGDWRDVLAELPRRIHEWMPRLAEAGVVGADAIFACLGPALEVYSRYTRVERASGEVVTLREYLEQVWAAVAREALTMIFAGADASGFEEDARLTAMWLWTLSAGADGNGGPGGTEGEADEEETPGKPAKKGGYYLEYDAARKIAQGLGAHLERLRTIVEVKGEQARLLPVAERSPALFGQEGPAPPQRRKAATQMSLFGDAEAAADERGGGEQLGVPAHGATVLDRVHQAMLLFAAGRGEALRRFLVEEGVGQDARIWRLAQALSALYPARSDEKRWVDGVLARKKGLGF